MKNSRLFLLLFLISLIIFFSDKKGWLDPIKNIASQPVVAAEGWMFRKYQEISGDSRGLRQSGKDKQIAILEEKLRQLAVQQNQLSACLEENGKMKKLLGAPLPAQWKFMEARVIGFPEKMRIDKGQRDGVKSGMMVIAENILVGKVVFVNENDSLVQLANDLASKIPVVVKRPGAAGVQARGLLLGQTKGGLVLERVLQSEDIQKGDLVATTGDETWLPDLLLGQIETVLPKSADVYQKAGVSPLIDYRQLRIVFLVIR